jgi:hypothetical protein
MVQGSVDHAERYMQLTLLGRDSFIRAVAPASLVRERGAKDYKALEKQERDLRNTYAEDTLLARIDGGLFSTESDIGPWEIFPLAKKINAPFADMITIGRTQNNDIVLKDITVSRFHTFFRQKNDAWTVCDAGSKNGTFLNGDQLKTRREVAVKSGDVVKLGDISTTFYTAADLFDVIAVK